MIAGPHQVDRTLIERFANAMSTDPGKASELFVESAEVHPGSGVAAVQGRAQIQAFFSKAPKHNHKVTAHLPRQGEDNFAEILIEVPGQPSTVRTVKFRTNGHEITRLEMVGSRKA